MNQEYFEKWGELQEKAQKHWQAFAELNFKTMQEFNNRNFEDFLKIKKPEDVIELQMRTLVDNGKITMNYLQKSWDLVQQSAKEFGKEVPVAGKK